VAPAELEARLVTNPDITDCCVIGVPHEFSGEVPRAYAVLSKPALERIRRDPEEANKIKAALIEVRFRVLVHASLAESPGHARRTSKTRRPSTRGWLEALNS
jgi:acyl-coenzyme A synthetase/AMP-(fatty) acid ligase